MLSSAARRAIAVNNTWSVGASAGTRADPARGLCCRSRAGAAGEVIRLAAVSSWLRRALAPRHRSWGCEFANFLTPRLVQALQFHTLSSQPPAWTCSVPEIRRAAVHCSLWREEAVLRFKGKMPMIPFLILCPKIILKCWLWHDSNLTTFAPQQSTWWHGDG